MAPLGAVTVMVTVPVPLVSVVPSMLLMVAFGLDRTGSSASSVVPAGTTTS